MSLSSSFGLAPELEATFRRIGHIVDPSIVELSRSLFADRIDRSLPPGDRRIDDVAYGTHQRQKLDICVPSDRGRPIAVFFPGGGMTGGDKSLYAHIPAFFARKGYVGVAANYRLAPEFLFPCGAQDVAGAIDWLAENPDVHGGDPRRILIVAQSAGAVHAASTIFDKRFHPRQYGSIRAAVLMSGVYKISPDYEGGNINLYFGDDPVECKTVLRSIMSTKDRCR